MTERDELLEDLVDLERARDRIRDARSVSPEAHEHALRTVAVYTRHIDELRALLSDRYGDADEITKDATEGVEPLIPRTSWRMPQGRGDLSGCGAHDQTVGPCAGEALPAMRRGSNGGTDTSSASGRTAVPRSLPWLRERLDGFAIEDRL